MRSRCSFAGPVMALALLATPGLSQTAAEAPPQGDIPPEAFASENAIIDTSVLFAIGAREAEQELRGAFGWPTFQEGLVEGVYFRFDPDGYARFAPTPRLDADVFEVICRPRTTACAGRKQQLSLFLNGQGQLQIRLDDAAAGDTFFISDGISELPVPERILMPLDARFESLLSAGGELIVRRGDNEVLRIPLTGFSAVANYLRWVAARQDYTVLARGWPVPNGTGAGGAVVTQPATWQSPMPQPQALPILAAPAEGQAAEVAVAEVRGELTALRELMLAREAVQTLPADAGAAGAAAGADRLADLERAALGIQSQIAALRGAELAATPPPALPATGAAMSVTPPAAPAPLAPAAVATPLTADTAAVLPAGPPGAAGTPPAVAAPETEADRTARRLAFLIAEIGLSPEAAVMLIGLQPEAAAPSGTTPPGAPQTLADDPIGAAYEDRLLTEMLKMLAGTAGADPGSAAASPPATAAAPAPAMTDPAAGPGLPDQPGPAAAGTANPAQALPLPAPPVAAGSAGPAAVAVTAAPGAAPAMAPGQGVSMAPPADQPLPAMAGLPLQPPSAPLPAAASVPAAAPPVPVALPSGDYMLLSDYFRAALAAAAAAQAGPAPAAPPAPAFPATIPAPPATFQSAGAPGSDPPVPMQAIPSAAPPAASGALPSAVVLVPAGAATGAAP